MSVGTMFKTVAAGAEAHKSEIMIGLGIASGLGAIFAAVKETPVCLEAVSQAEAELEEVTTKDAEGNEVVVKDVLDWKAKLLIFAKHYWPAALLECGSIFLIVWGTKIRFDSYTALAAVYGVTKAELDDIKKTISEHPESWKKKFDEKRGEMHLAESNPDNIPAPKMSNTEVPMPLQLFFDDQAKVYFRLSEEDLRDALAEITHVVETDPFQATTMNDWMRILDHEEVQNGDYYIFSVEDADGPLKYNQIGVKAAPNGEPARMMKFNRDYRLDTRGMYTNV